MNESVVFDINILDAISKAKRGDEKAYTYLIDLLKPTFKNISKKYYLPKGDKDDLYQVALIGLYRGVLSFKDGISTKPIEFLKLCMKREIYTLIKESTRQKHAYLNDSISLDMKYITSDNLEYTLLDVLPNDKDDLEGLVLEKEFISNIDVILSILSKVEKEIFSLYLNGFTPLDIACKLNKTTKQIDNALQRSKRKLKDSLLSKM